LVGNPLLGVLEDFIVGGIFTRPRRTEHGTLHGLHLEGEIFYLLILRGLFDLLAESENHLDGVVELTLEMFFVAETELERFAFFGELFEGVGHVFGGFGLDIGGVATDASETEGGIGHLVDIETLGGVLGLVIFGEGVEEEVELFLVFVGEQIDPGEEIVPAGVLGRALLAGFGGRSVTLGSIGAGSLLLGFGTRVSGFHWKPPFDFEDTA